MQTKILCGMAGVSLYEPSQQIFTECSLLVLDNLEIYMKVLTAYRCLLRLDFTGWLMQRSSIYHTRFHQTAPLLVPKMSNRHSEQCISYRGPKIWNELPLYVREQTYNCFKIKSKRILLARQSSSNS